ncbi:MAG: hypothetical protein KFH98_02145 [Gemmatimonadetes bacterium]|nr:hypothetical protein [Gemmatimonadota bacterium]
MSRFRGCSLVLVVFLIPAALTAQEPTQPLLRVTGAELSIGGRVQTQFNTTSVDGQAPSQLFLRRARIEVGVKVNDLVSGVLQPDFGNDNVELKDAYLKLDLSPAVQLLAGKAYRPFGLLEQTSSKRMLPIERGLRIRGVGAVDEYAVTSGPGYSNRDIGFQLLGSPEGAPLGLAYAAGVFRGPLHGVVGAQDSYQFAARVTGRPVDGIRVGAGWSSRDFIVEPGETPGLERGHAFEIDVEYGAFAPGFHLMAELSRGDIDPLTDATFQGAHAWLAYRTEALSTAVSAVEPVFRASYAGTDAMDGAGVVAGGTLLTPGINIYFGALNRIMLNYDIWQGGDGSQDARSLKAMFQLGF